MKRNVSVVSFEFCCNILISGKIIEEVPGSVASGTHCTSQKHYCSIEHASYYTFLMNMSVTLTNRLADFKLV